MRIPVWAIFWATILSAGLTNASAGWGALPTSEELPKTFRANDTLALSEEASTDAAECLAGIAWTPGAFDVTVTGARSSNGSFRVQFESARPLGDETNDRVTMEWYCAENTDKAARAVVVVHESGSDMVVGRMIARGLAGQGLHAFMLQLPGYGDRRPKKVSGDPQQLNLVLCQAIADVRRARDVVASLPMIDSSHIALEGTSLGGFVVATTAALDNAYNSVFVVLAGGDMFDVLTRGKKDAAKIRTRLLELGVDDAGLRRIVSSIEPLRLAHRLDTERLWIYSARFDDVVPPKNTLLLANAAKLPDDRHIRLFADHYTGIVFLPMVVNHIRDVVKDVKVLATP